MDSKSFILIFIIVHPYLYNNDVYGDFHIAG